MEIEKLTAALEETISFLQRSHSSNWASTSVEELIRDLEAILGSIRSSGSVDEQLLGFLFAPTGAIQETSIDNGWSDDFLRLADIVDQYTADR